MNAITEIKPEDRPLSEQFRIVARQFVDADAAANLLEELKTTTLEQKKQKLQDETDERLPDSHLERMVKASDDWEEYIREMCKHRAKANKLKVQMTYLKMKFDEWRTKNANARSERQF